MKKITILTVLLISHGIAYGANNGQPHHHLAQQVANNPLLANVQNHIAPAQVAEFEQLLLQAQNANDNQQLNVPFGANELGAAPMVDADNLNVGVINELPAPSPE